MTTPSKPIPFGPELATIFFGLNVPVVRHSNGNLFQPLDAIKIVGSSDNCQSQTS